MATIEVDPRPIDEAAAGPEGCRAERVELMQNPGLSTADAAGAGIKSYRQPLPGHIAAVAADLEAAGQERTVVVQPPGFERRRLWSAGGPPR